MLIGGRYRDTELGLAAKEAGRALLVEDSYVNQLVASGMLQNIGYQVSIATNGAEALKMVQSYPYDIILMDCLMPVLDGYQATKQIRMLQGPEGRTPIIALTASAMAGDRDKCLLAGMDDYLSKPLDHTELSDVLAAVKQRNPKRWHSDQRNKSQTVPRNRSHVDEATLAGLRKLGATGDGTLLPKVIEAYLSDTPSRIHEMKSALRTTNASGIAQAAHALKGSCRNIGARHLAELADMLEQIANSGQLDSAQDTIMLIESEFEGVRITLAGEITLAS